MKSKKEDKKIAKLIFHSVLVSGKPDETKLNKFIKIVRAYPTTQAKYILKHLENLFVRSTNDNRLEIESAFNLSLQEEAEIKKVFGKMLYKDLQVQTKENKTLIGGIRVTNGDWVWEDTVVSKLNQLKGNFINE